MCTKLLLIDLITKLVKILLIAAFYALKYFYQFRDNIQHWNTQKEGKPKKRTKQLTFNKTSFDKEKKNGNQKKVCTQSFARDAWL